MSEEEKEIEIMKWKKDIECEGGQLVVWPGIFIEDGQEDEFMSFIDHTFKGVEPVIVGCVVTLPDPEHRDMEEPPTGGRTDVFFYIKGPDIGKFAIARLMHGMRWWEDVFYNKQEDIYPQEFRDAYPPKW